MRTTLTLDDDVAIGLHELCTERQERFKTVVNEALRAGLAALAERRARPARSLYATPPVDLGAPSVPNLDDIGAVLAIAEGEEHP